TRQPFLAACLHKEKGKYYLESLVDPGIAFHFLPRWNSEHWIPVAEAELANRIDIASGPLFRCTYLYDPTTGYGDIILSFSHFIMDAASVSQFIHELLTICASFIGQRTIPIYQLPPAPPAESRFPSAFGGLGLRMNTLRYAFRQMADELAYRIKTRDKRIPPLHINPARGHILSMQLSEELLESFAQRARREGVTLNSALNAALMLAVNRNLYAGQQVPMRALSFANLRPYVQPPLRDEEMACYISPLRYTVSVAGGIGFWSLARDLHAKVYSSLKSGDKFVAATLAEGLMKRVTRFKSFRMGATALNYSGVTPVQPNYDDIEVIGLHGFVSAYNLGPEFSAEAQVFNHQLFLDFSYLEADMSREEARAIMDEIKNIVHSAIASSEVMNQSAS
ncbi:MAG TPA: hypothetical protein VK249_30490, partial [Anaerolineales bacterium]|nr:hypothetical protein [Anaerolineales bacterium]